MHLPGGADDGIDRARLYAQRAAYAERLVDDGYRARALHAVLRVERDDRPAEQPRQSAYAFCAARRTLVDRRLARRHRLGIRATVRIAALGALGLRQQVFEAVGKWWAGERAKVGFMHGAIIPDNIARYKLQMKKPPVFQQAASGPVKLV